MKKILSLIMAIAVLLLSTTVCFAAFEEHPEFGMAYTLPDGWNFLEKDLIGVTYVYDSSIYEALFFYVIPFDGEFIDFTDKEALLSFCNTRYSDENLAQELAESNDATINIVSNVVTNSYETHNGVNYFKYHKQYTASANGFYDAGFSITAYVAQPNDNMYLIVHDRSTSASDHATDVTSVLDSISYAPAEIKIVINGQRIYPDSAPMIVNDRTMVPIRAVAEKMGFEVSWDAASYTASVKNPADSSVVNYKIDSNIAIKSTGEQIAMDVAPFISSDRTYLPLRAVAESLGAKVEWIAESRTVNITY